jgi:hypothetical protein
MSKEHPWDLTQVSNMASLVIFSFDNFFRLGNIPFKFEKMMRICLEDNEK